ncbi:MAG: hypothetical protein ACTSP5_14180 [Candidatus Heimdallarchaeota archaeon]
MATTFNLFTSISWIITGVVSAVLSSLFLRKNPRKRLNQLFSAGFISWSISMLFNGVNFAVVYRSLTIANIFRDLSVVFGIFSAFALIAAAIGIYFGAESVNWIVILVLVAIAGTLSGLGAANDWVTVDGLGGFKTTDNLAANVLLILTYRSSENPQAKRRIGFFIIGYSTILFGQLIFLIDNFVNISPYVFPVLALITWVTGPILMLVGFYVKADSHTPSLPKDGSVNTESQLLATQKEQNIERPS